MHVVTEYFIEILGVIFVKSFDIVSNVKSNEFLELFLIIIGIFILHDRVSFLK
jgi:hypothetical protein